MLNFFYKLKEKIIPRNETITLHNSENVEHADRIDVASVMKNVINHMDSIGYVFKDDTLTTPSGVNFKNDDCTVYEVFEVFCNNDYAFFTNSESNLVIFDVGMNMAASTLFFASLYNVSAVYAFEPFLPTFNRAMENVSLNPTIMKKIKMFQFGLGNKNSTFEVPFNIHQSGCMSSTHNVFELNKDLCKDIESYETISIKSSFDVLRPIVSTHTNDKLILKVDTEGAEFDIFESLDTSGFLSVFDLVMLEYHFKSPQEIEDRLTKNGFIVFYKGVFKKDEKIGFVYAVNNRKSSF